MSIKSGKRFQHSLVLQSLSVAILYMQSNCWRSDVIVFYHVWAKSYNYCLLVNTIEVKLRRVGQ